MKAPAALPRKLLSVLLVCGLAAFALRCGGDDGGGVTAPDDPAIELSETSKTFSATTGSGDPPAQTLAISNGGDGTLSGLAAAISYAPGQPTGWLSATLSATTAPSTLTLTATTGPLPAGTYSATVGISSGVAANSPQSVVITYTVAAPAVPVAELPLAEGKRWRYQGLDSTVICATSTGCNKLRFSGEYVVHVEGQEQWQGRSAWRTIVYKLPSLTDATGMSVRVEHVYQGPEGLERWVSTGSGGNWRTILSRQNASYGNSTFLLLDGPTHEDNMILSQASATVPAGSFTTVRALHEYRETGQFATRDIFETRTEDYASGVGLVAGHWEYSYDDNDPAAADIVSEGEILLTHVDNGPFPEFIAEQEPNDTSTTATAASALVLARGAAAITDPGSILTDAAVGCPQECVFANQNGEKRFQDWYRFELTTAKAVRIDLTYETSVSENDLDLYAFGAAGSGLQFLAASTAENGLPEALTGTAIPPGIYYLAVQAWDTPSGPVSYWLSIR